MMTLGAKRINWKRHNNRVGQRFFDSGGGLETVTATRGTPKLKKLMNEVKQQRRKILNIFQMDISKQRQAGITCKGIGCYGCCYQVVGTYFCEGVMIADALIRYNYMDRLRHLIDQGEEQNEFYNNQPMGLDKGLGQIASAAWMSMEQPCALLEDRIKRCALYGLRPVACASYYVHSDPKLCYPPPKQKVLMLNNSKVFYYMNQLDRWFIKETLGYNTEVIVLYPLGIAVTMGALYLTDGPKALRTKFLKNA